MPTSTALKNLMLDLSKIKIDQTIQCRAEFDDALARDYADRMLIGDMFPPLSVFYDQHDYWLADGFHRYEAARLAGRKHV